MRSVYKYNAPLRQLTEMAEVGALKPVLDENHYALSEVGAAHERLVSGKGMGKVVVEI